MNHFHFAIASIVDANTGNGLVQHGSRIDYAAAASYGRRIRSKSILALLQQVKARLSAALASIRERQAEKRNLRRIAGLNDHMLEDIGISRGDVMALKMGLTDLRQLDAQRCSKHSMTRLQRSASTSDVGSKVGREAFNEAIFAKARCA